MTTAQPDLTSKKSTIVRLKTRVEDVLPRPARPPLPRSKGSLQDIPDFFSPKKGTTVRAMKREIGRALVKAACRVAPGRMALWAGRRMLATRRHEQPARERELLAPAEPFTVRSGGVPVAAWRWGEDAGEKTPVVILAHGWDGRGGQMASFAGPLVEAGFQVVTFDAPGHGLTPGRSSSFPEMRAAIEDVAWTVRARHWGTSYAVVAHSAGAVAAAWAARRGLGVERLVLVAPPADPVEWTWRQGRAAGLSDAVLTGMRRRIERRFDMSWEELRTVVQAPRMRQAALVVHDRGDRVIPFREGAELAAAWPGALLLATEGLGHQRILRHPEVVAAAVEHLDAGRPRVASRDLAKAV